MKKFLKFLGIIVGSIVLLIVIAGVTINVRGIPSYETKEVNLKVEMDSASIANGEKLAAMICNACHRGKNTVLLEGRELDEDPKFGKSGLLTLPIIRRTDPADIPMANSLLLCASASKNPDNMLLPGCLNSLIWQMKMSKISLLF